MQSIRALFKKLNKKDPEKRVELSVISSKEPWKYLNNWRTKKEADNEEQKDRSAARFSTAAAPTA